METSTFKPGDICSFDSKGFTPEDFGINGNDLAALESGNVEIISLDFWTELGTPDNEYYTIGQGDNLRASGVSGYHLMIKDEFNQSNL